MDYTGSEKIIEEYIEVKVGEPRIIPKKDGRRKHTEYYIEIETNSFSFTLNQSKVSRRYSDFVWLHQQLRKSPCMPKPPRLPPKSHIWNFNATFLSERRRKLQKYIRRIVQETVFLSSTYLHLFLQTNMTPKEMDSCIKRGDITEAILNSEYDVNEQTFHMPEKKAIRRHSTFTSVTWKIRTATLSKIIDRNGNTNELPPLREATKELEGRMIQLER